MCWLIKVKQKQQKQLVLGRNICANEYIMQLKYSLSVYLPSQYGYPNERNFTVKRVHKREKLLK